MRDVGRKARMAGNCSWGGAKCCGTSEGESGGVSILILREELESQTEFVGHHPMVAASWAELLGSFSGPQCTCICKNGKLTRRKAVLWYMDAPDGAQSACLRYHHLSSWLHMLTCMHCATRELAILD